MFVPLHYRGVLGPGLILNVRYDDSCPQEGRSESLTAPIQLFTLDVETATAFRGWLFETGVENHAEPQIADPLAEPAAAIGGTLHESTGHVVINASTTVFSPTDYGQRQLIIGTQIVTSGLFISTSMYSYPR